MRSYLVGACSGRPAGLPPCGLVAFPRENATADHKRDHSGKENPKLHLICHGVLRRPIPRASARALYHTVK